MWKVKRTRDAKADEDAKVVAEAFKTGGKSAAVAKINEFIKGQPMWVGSALLDKAMMILVPGSDREARLKRNEILRSGKVNDDLAPVGDSVKCQCESSVCGGHGNGPCGNMATRDVPTIYGAYKMCRKCAEALPADFKKTGDAADPIHPEMAANAAKNWTPFVEQLKSRIDESRDARVRGFRQEEYNSAKKALEGLRNAKDDRTFNMWADILRMLRRKTGVNDDLAPVGMEDPKRALALKKYEEGETVAQDKRTAKDSVPHKFQPMPGNRKNQPCNRCLEHKSRGNHHPEAIKEYEADKKRQAKDVLPIPLKTSNAVPMPTENDGAQRYAADAVWVQVDKGEWRGPSGAKAVSIGAGRWSAKVPGSKPGNEFERSFGSLAEARKWADSKAQAMDASPRLTEKATYFPGGSLKLQEGRIWATPYKAEFPIKQFTSDREAIAYLANCDKVKAKDASGREGGYSWSTGKKNGEVWCKVDGPGLNKGLEGFENDKDAKEWALEEIKDAKAKATDDYEKSKKSMCGTCGKNKRAAGHVDCESCMRKSKAKATDHAGSEPVDHLKRAMLYEVGNDRARALDAYRTAASGFRRAGDAANEAKAREGITACQSGYDIQYTHPGAGRVKVCDSASVALRTALERTRAGEVVSVVGTTVRPGKARVRASDYAPWPEFDAVVRELSGVRKKLALAETAEEEAAVTPEYERLIKKKRDIERAGPPKKATDEVQPVGDAATLEGVQNYEFTHGKLPRGYGSWLFSSKKGGSIEFEHRGSFTAAKAAAIKWANGKGLYEVWVLT